MPPKKRRSRGRGRGAVPEKQGGESGSVGVVETFPTPSTSDVPIKSSMTAATSAEKHTRGRGAVPKERSGESTTVGVVETFPTPSTSVVPVKSSMTAATSQVESDVDVITKAMRRLGLELTYNDDSHHVFAIRPGFGKLGTKINLIANYFSIDIPHGNIYHYDIEIDKISTEQSDTDSKKEVGVEKTSRDSHKKYKCKNTRLKRNVVETMIRAEDMFNNILPAFDGEKNLYTRKPLSIVEEKTFFVTVNEVSGRSLKYEIKIKPVIKTDEYGIPIGNSISLEPLHQLFDGKHHNITPEIVTATMAIETILRHGPALQLVPVGRSFFQKPVTEQIIISGGREIWFGHYQNIQFTKFKPMLNIDRSATTFYKSGSVLEYLLAKLYPRAQGKDRTLRQITILSDANLKSLRQDLKDVTIEVTHLPYPRKYRVFSITKESASNTYFKLNVQGKEIQTSVSQYFQSQYEKLKYPNLPCLNVGSKVKNTYLPMEVCNIVEGQHSREKLSPDQTKEMIKRTACPPAERFREISHSIQTICRNFYPFSREFDIRINTNPMKFVGRKLNPPQIMYQGDQIKQPFRGSWDMKDTKFYTAADIRKWMLLNFSNECNQQDLENFARKIRAVGKNVGINFSQPRDIKSFSPRDGTPRNIIKRAKQIDSNLELAIVVLPNKDSQNIYSEIKTVAETELGLMTQCIKDSNATGERNLPVIGNLCQKINAKLGGVNNSLVPTEKPRILDQRAIIIGADCFHTSPKVKSGYSIAAAVGSVDGFPSRYQASIRAQKPKILKDGMTTGREIIIDLKEMVKELLQAFTNNNKGRKPQKIIFYRDGVSLGDFHKIITYELEQIREACREMRMSDGKNEIPITFIIVSKRHHTRFMPENPRDGVGKCGNIPPGTTVDTHVIHPIFFDFFMCSHAGIQGTSRSAHYTVLLDENNFSADDIQSLTYQLCHTYVRCTRSISIPCPVMYADLAAYRANLYVMDRVKDVSSTSSEMSEMEQNFLMQNIKEAIKVVQDMQNKMFFV